MTKVSIFELVVTQIFDWESPNKKVKIAFFVSDIIDAILLDKCKYTVAKVPIDREWALSELPKRELNMRLVHSMSDLQATSPVIYAQLGIYHILIDGSHRYMARTLRNFETCNAFLLETEAWLPFAKIEGDLADAGQWELQP